MLALRFPTGIMVGVGLVLRSVVRQHLGDIVRASWKGPAVPAMLALWRCLVTMWLAGADSEAQAARIELPCVKVRVDGLRLKGRCVRSLASFGKQALFEVDGVVVVPEERVSSLSMPM